MFDKLFKLTPEEIQQTLKIVKSIENFENLKCITNYYWRNLKESTRTFNNKEVYSINFLTIKDILNKDITLPNIFCRKNRKSYLPKEYDENDCFGIWLSSNFTCDYLIKSQYSKYFKDFQCFLEIQGEDKYAQRIEIFHVNKFQEALETLIEYHKRLILQ